MEEKKCPKCGYPAREVRKDDNDNAVYRCSNPCCIFYRNDLPE